MRERTEKLKRRYRLLGAAVLALSVGTGLAGAALASGHVSTKADLSAAPVPAGPLAVPTGAALKFTAGEEAVYTWRRPASLVAAPNGAGGSGSGQLCLVWHQPAEPGPAHFHTESVSCANATNVESEGMLVVHGSNGKPTSVAVLTPNGVTRITATDSNGASYTVSTPNNAVSLRDPAITSVSYTLPDGASHVTNIPSDN